jgi:hypothetical protein
MPAGTGDPMTAAAGKPGDARGGDERKDLANSLQADAKRIANRKDGVTSVIYILVGPQVDDYRRDISFVPGAIHLRKASDTKNKKSPDSVEWILAGEGRFKLKFRRDSPFKEGKEFDDKTNRIGRVSDDAPEGSYRYNLTYLEFDGRRIDLDPLMRCPEIIIER